MNKNFTIPLVYFVITMCTASCCKIDKSKFDFTSEELKLLANYEQGDTIYFKSNLGNIDTITVIQIEDDAHTECGGFTNPKPFSSRSIVIKHLPVDSWYSTSQKGKDLDTNYQSLISVTKFPISNTIEYSLDYKGHNNDNEKLCKEMLFDTIVINNNKISNYYKSTNFYPGRHTEPKDIVQLYWTIEQGLTAYENAAGETWLKIK